MAAAASPVRTPSRSASRSASRWGITPMSTPEHEFGSFLGRTQPPRDGAYASPPRPAAALPILAAASARAGARTPFHERTAALIRAADAALAEREVRGARTCMECKCLQQELAMVEATRDNNAAYAAQLSLKLRAAHFEIASLKAKLHGADWASQEARGEAMQRRRIASAPASHRRSFSASVSRRPSPPPAANSVLEK